MTRNEKVVPSATGYRVNRLEVYQRKPGKETTEKEEPFFGQNKPGQVASKIWIRIGSSLCPKALLKATE